MKFRKGDVVSVRGVVKYDERDDSAGLFVDIPGVYSTAMFSPREQKQAKLKLEQAYFEVGDGVRWTGVDGGFGYGTILALANDHAWIDLGGGDYCTRTLSSIDRVEIGGGDEAIA